MKNITIDWTDALAGILFILFGLLFGVQSLGLEIGTAFRMGPGYFPLVLSGILILLGLAIIASAIHDRGSEAIGTLAWRGAFFILPAPIFFGLTVRGLGFVPAIFLTTLIAALASFKMRPHSALLLAAAVTVFATLVFSYGLGLPFRRFGPWLPF
ncbi:tripartite tricarboxylate transporter TctB family protein [Tabrizicola aquatica]|uniref:tripartite tricarboxylate transporter TctB family protein n=1 Tax=Tabrizicola aquatica TaxID=909926 RepID=UPI000CD3042A|nr:tripartite tricarboxylate transporter TctB family protein [Tabrizicola aquatica]